MASRTAASAGVALAFVVAACSGARVTPQTGLMVVIATNMQPSELDAIRVEVVQEPAPGRKVFDSSRSVQDGGVTLPTTVFIESDRTAHPGVDIRVSASLAGVPVALREVQVQAPTDRIAIL